MKYINVEAAAARLGITVGRVRTLCQEGKIKGEKLGTIWAIKIKSVEEFEQSDRKPGRPKKIP